MFCRSLQYYSRQKLFEAKCKSLSLISSFAFRLVSCSIDDLTPDGFRIVCRRFENEVICKIFFWNVLKWKYSGSLTAIVETLAHPFFSAAGTYTSLAYLIPSVLSYTELSFDCDWMQTHSSLGLTFNFQPVFCRNPPITCRKQSEDKLWYCL